MSKIRETFDVAIDISGATIIVVRDPLCSACLSDDEVDFEIQALKTNLDQVAKYMKRAIQKQRNATLSLEVSGVSGPEI